MKEIDWSKAPEGATHHLRDNSGFVEDSFVFEMEDRYKEVGSSCYLMKKHLKGSWALTPRPQAWSGEGLPPVGVIVKLRTKRSPEDAFEGWGKAEIMYSSKGAVVWRWQGHSREFGAEWDDVEFEAIRTPEQIAAEERKQLQLLACADIEADLSQYNTSIDCSAAIRAAVDAMIAAGYRKQEQTK